MNNTVCGVFLCRLVCGNLADFLYTLTELFQFVVHNSTDENGKRTQRGDQWPQQMTSMFKAFVITTVSGVYLFEVVYGN